MDNIPKEIQTDRLVLRPVILEYAERINGAIDEQVTKYMFMSPETPEKTREWVEKTMTKNKAGEDWAASIFLKETDELIGGVGLHELKTDTPELGIWLGQTAWRKGYGREAVNAVVDWAAANLEYEYLKYPVDRNNISSRKIPDSLGGILEKEYPMETPSGKKLDLVEYHIYRKESDDRG